MATIQDCAYDGKGVNAKPPEPRLLLLDDDPSLINEYREKFTKLGFEVIPCQALNFGALPMEADGMHYFEDEEQLAEIFANVPFDAVLSDNTMIGQKGDYIQLWGQQALEILKASPRADVPFYIHSGGYSLNSELPDGPDGKDNNYQARRKERPAFRAAGGIELFEKDYSGCSDICERIAADIHRRLTRQGQERE